MLGTALSVGDTEIYHSVKSFLKDRSPLFLAIFCQNFYIWGIVHETVAII